jgi:hypothetical protein
MFWQPSKSSSNLKQEKKMNWMESQ